MGTEDYAAKHNDVLFIGDRGTGLCSASDRGILENLC